MKTINLKKYYYPICKKDTFVEVPDEVADAIAEEAAQRTPMTQSSTITVTLLDASPGIEHHFPEQVISPEDILMEKETEREQEAAHAPDDGTAPGGPCHPDAPGRRAAFMPGFGRASRLRRLPRPRASRHQRHCHGSQRHYQVTEILYQARLDEAAKGECDMHKEITAQAKQKKDEREEVLKEIRQLENRQKILENKQRNEERKARTRRLIERGAILEGIFPLAPRPSRRRGQRRS